MAVIKTLCVVALWLHQALPVVILVGALAAVLWVVAALISLIG